MTNKVVGLGLARLVCSDPRHYWRRVVWNMTHSEVLEVRKMALEIEEMDKAEQLPLIAEVSTPGGAGGNMELFRLLERKLENPRKATRLERQITDLPLNMHMAIHQPNHVLLDAHADCRAGGTEFELNARADRLRKKYPSITIETKWHLSV